MMNFLEYIEFDALLDFIFSSIDTMGKNDRVIEENILNDICFNTTDIDPDGIRPVVHFKSKFDEDNASYRIYLDIHNSEYGMKLETNNIEDRIDSYKGDLVVSFYDKGKNVVELDIDGFSLFIGDNFTADRIMLKDNDAKILDEKELIDFDILNLSFNSLFGSITKNEYYEFMFDVMTYDDEMKIINDDISICEDYEIYFDYISNIITKIHDYVLNKSSDNKYDILAYVIEEILSEYFSSISSKETIIKYLKEFSQKFLNDGYALMSNREINDFSFEDKDVPKILKRSLKYGLMARKLELNDDEEDYEDE